MAQTTLATLATVVPDEFIVPELLAEARAFNVISPLVANHIMPAGSGVTWRQSQLPSSTAAAVTEASDITCAAQTTTENSITVAEVGLGIELTDKSGETAKVANDLLTWAGSCGRAIAEKITGDLAALFTALNDGTGIGTSGTNITAANFIEAMYTLDSQNAPGQKYCVLHPRQVADLFNAISAATGTPYASLNELVRDGRLPTGTPAVGFVGQLFGIPVYSTTQCPTANSAADRSGAMFVREAMAFVQQRPLRVEYQRDASKRSTEVIVTMSYGVGEIVDNFGCPIETDA